MLQVLASMDLGEDVPRVPESPEERVEFWSQKLSGRARELLLFLFQRRGEAVAAEAARP